MIREFKETDLNSIMRLWLETNISAHYFIDKNTNEIELVMKWIDKC